jgi:acyl-coenzyme A thioesterase PaaI-like protein
LSLALRGTPIDLAAEGWEPLPSGDGFIALVGPLWQRSDGDGTAYAFLAEPKHRNSRGVVHGGMLMTFADRALGATARRATDNSPVATIQLDMHFVRAVQIDERVETRPRIVRRTRSVLFIQGDLTVGFHVVGTANGIWKVLAARSADPQGPT